MQRTEICQVSCAGVLVCRRRRRVVWAASQMRPASKIEAGWRTAAGESNDEAGQTKWKDMKGEQSRLEQGEKKRSGHSCFLYGAVPLNITRAFPRERHQSRFKRPRPLGNSLPRIVLFLGAALFLRFVQSLLSKVHMPRCMVLVQPFGPLLLWIWLYFRVRIQTPQIRPADSRASPGSQNSNLKLAFPSFLGPLLGPCESVGSHVILGRSNIVQ